MLRFLWSVWVVRVEALVEERKEEATKKKKLPARETKARPETDGQRNL